MEQEFETGVRLIRDAFTKKLSTKESELIQLKTESARKDADIKALQSQVSALQSELKHSENQMLSLNKQLARLAHFKQSVLDSFEDEDYGMLKQKLEATSSFVSRTASPAATGSSRLIPAIAAAISSGSGRGSTFLRYPSADVSAAINDNSLVPNSTFADMSPVKPPVAQIKQQQKQPIAIPDPQDSLNDARSAAAMAQRLNVQAADARSTANERLEAIASPTTPATSTITDLANQPVINQSASSAAIDGRQFFRQAKTILSYDEFTSLLWNVKAYNGRDQSRSQTLNNVQLSIAKKYPDLFAEFQKLLVNR